jgi:DNA-binding NarL/FixJ family response regulator
MRADATATVLLAPTCKAGLDLANAHPDLDLVVLDLHLPGLSGIDALRAWRMSFPAAPVVVVSANEGWDIMHAVHAAGAAGFVPKAASNEVLLAALQVVLAGGKYFPVDAFASAAGLETADRARSPELTRRQLEVLLLVAQGKSNKLICRELKLSERTVKLHLTEVYRTLGVSTRTQAALAAAKMGLVGTNER